MSNRWAATVTVEHNEGGGYDGESWWAEDFDVVVTADTEEQAQDAAVDAVLAKGLACVGAISTVVSRVTGPNRGV